MDLLKRWSRYDQGTIAVFERGFRIIFFNSFAVVMKLELHSN